MTRIATTQLEPILMWRQLKSFLGIVWDSDALIPLENLLIDQIVHLHRRKLCPIQFFFSFSKNEIVELISDS